MEASIPHNRIKVEKQLVDAASRVILSGQWTDGRTVSKLERSIQNKFGVNRAVGISSGLAALRLALLSLNIGKGDYVVVPAYSCVAIPNAVASVGACPIPVDIDNNSFNIGRSGLRSISLKHVRAIIAVNTFGVCADVDALKEFGIPVIEDCSHGFEFLVNDCSKMLGKLHGDISIFSFYTTKLISGGQGGCLISNDRKIVNTAIDLREYADKNHDSRRQNDRMSDITASLVLSNLEAARTNIGLRNKIATRYISNLRDFVGQISLPSISDEKVFYRFPVTFPGKSGCDLIKHLRKYNIIAEKPVESWLGDRLSNFPNSNMAFREVVSIPIYPSLTMREVDRVSQGIKEFME